MAVLSLLPLDGVAHLEEGLLIMIFEIMLSIPADLEALGRVVFCEEK